MRFAQLDSVFGQYEWSGTIDSYNKKIGNRAFIDFDYSNFTDIELRFLQTILNSEYFDLSNDENGKEYASDFVIKAHPLEHRKWYWVDSVLNFAPTDDEILKSINGNPDIFEHPLASKQIEIIKSQLKDVVGVGESLFLWPDFDFIVSQMAEKRTRLECSNVLLSQLLLADVLKNGSETPNLTTSNDDMVLFNIAVDSARKYLNLTKIDQFDPFLYNLIVNTSTRQEPLYLLWLASHENDEYRKIANDYGIFVTKNKTGLPSIKVGDIGKLISISRDSIPGIGDNEILPGTGKIQTPFSSIRGVPIPSIREKIFYLRLFHGISASPDQRYSDKFGYPPHTYNTRTKERINPTRIENMDDVYQKKYPFRMRYENQFLLPEPFYRYNKKYPSSNDERKVIKFERANFHFIAGQSSPTKTIDPYQRFLDDAKYKKEDMDYWYYGLWCHAVDDSNEKNRKYYPTGFSLSKYNVFDTEPNEIQMGGVSNANTNPISNYTRFGSNSYLDDMENVTYWFDSRDTVSDGIDNKSPNGTIMTQNGPRGGIPVNYLSILKIESEIKGRELIKEAEIFSNAIKDGLDKKEILPVIYGVDGSFKDVINEYGEKKTKLSIANESFKNVSQKNVKTIAVESGKVVEKEIENLNLIAYISNIQSLDKNHPHFKYHERVWNKQGTGVYAKIGDPFSPSTWIGLFDGNNPLNRAFPENTFESDFDASVFIPNEYKGSCSDKKTLMYPRTLIEPDFTSVFSKPWLDSHSGDGKTLTELEYKIYLIVFQAAITSLKKLQSIALVNTEFGIDRRKKEFSISVEQRKIFEQIFSGYFFDGRKIPNEKTIYRMFSDKKISGIPNFWSEAENLAIDALKAKSTSQVYWGLNAATALFQLQYAVTHKILDTSKTFISGNYLPSIWLKAETANGIIKDIIYGKFFKYSSTAYKWYADFYAALEKKTTIAWFKVASTSINSIISLWAWESAIVRSFSERLGIGKNAFGWIVTGTFLVISETLDNIELGQKREKLKQKFIDAYKGGYIEGPYVQSGGQIKIKKTSDGKLPVAYDSNGNPTSYQDVQSETIKKREDYIIKSYDDLMGKNGESLFWSHLSCEDARILKQIIDKDRQKFKSYRMSSNFTGPIPDINPAPRVVDVAPNHFDLGIHTSDREQSFDIFNNLIKELFKQYDPYFLHEGIPYTNAKLINDLYFEWILENKTELVRNQGETKILEFLPNYKYARDANTIKSSDSLSKYFTGTHKSGVTEFGIKKLILTVPPYLSIHKVNNPLWSTGISDSEKVYLIRKKYGLDLVNPNFGKGCCFMEKLIDTEKDYNDMNWPNDGIVRSDWESNLSPNSPKIKSLTRYKDVSSGKEIQGCEYQVTLSTEEVYQKLIEKIQECETNCFSDDTKVISSNGEIEISKIKIGDEVISFDENGNLHNSIVTKTFHHTENVSDLYRYSLENGKYLDITKNHPVLTEKNEFVEIGNLLVGDYLITDKNERTKIVSIEFLKQDFTYNISVEPNSTYIANGIRVHNKPVPAPIDDYLPVTRYDDNINTLAESLIEVNEIDEPEPDLDCQLYGICNDVTCPTCSPSPRFLKICSIPELCLPPKYSNGAPGSMPTWLYAWLQYDFRNEWSSIVRNYNQFYAWWNLKNKPIDIDFQFRPYDLPPREPLSTPLQDNAKYIRRKLRSYPGNTQTSNTGG